MKTKFHPWNQTSRFTYFTPTINSSTGLTINLVIDSIKRSGFSSNFSKINIFTKIVAQVVKVFNACRTISIIVISIEATNG